MRGREIKFRAIVPVNEDKPKEMRYYDLSRIDDLNRLAYEDWAIDQLMQFTSLKDRTGKEIYDSDILQDNQKYLWIVSWNEDHACFQCKTLGDIIVCEVIDNQNMIVVGNVHENPELL